MTFDIDSLWQATACDDTGAAYKKMREAEIAVNTAIQRITNEELRFELDILVGSLIYRSEFNGFSAAMRIAQGVTS